MMIYEPNGKSFGNLGLGPVVSIENIEQKNNTMENLLERGLVITAFITDKEHPVFDMFLKSDAKIIKEPIAVFVTAYYLEENFS